MITINSDKFKIIDKLYHYTSLSALASILKSGILRFGVLPRMNDITEAVKEIYLQHDNENTNWDNISRVEEELKLIGLISLTQDGTRAGYAINSMWGHYAEKGEGCCIIFDKEGIIKECNKLDFRYGCVTYDGAAPDIIVNNNHNDIGLLKSSFEENFLHKSQDWENEQEFRIVNFNTSNGIGGLPIMDCIIAVAFHTNCNDSVFGCPMKQDCLRGLDGIPALEYHYSHMWGNKRDQALLKDIKGIDWIADDYLKHTIDD